MCVFSFVRCLLLSFFVGVYCVVVCVACALLLCVWSQLVLRLVCCLFCSLFVRMFIIKLFLIVCCLFRSCCLNGLLCYSYKIIFVLRVVVCHVSSFLFVMLCSYFL